MSCPCKHQIALLVILTGGPRTIAEIIFRYIPNLRSVNVLAPFPLAGHVAVEYGLNVQENAAVSAFAALSLETRLQAVQLLARMGADGLPAGEIARRLNIPQSTLSDHLGILTRAGLVSSERRSRSIIYRAEGKILTELQKFLHQLSAGGDTSHIR